MVVTTIRLERTRYLITAGLPYINGIKHLGNLIGSMLPADIYARFLRQHGHEVLFICGTDEHGAPAELAAEAAGEPVAEYCARMYQTQADIYRRFGLTFDYFGRSSSRPNHELTQQVFQQLDEGGFIIRRSMTQFYSLEENRFLADRYIEGTCPKCGYERARGDQCENCTSLLDATDLQNPRSSISGSERLELRESEHLFLDLAKLQPRVRAWVDQQKEWPALSRQIANKWLNEGLKERCITRNLKWGVDVPLPGFEELVFYVWFDAPIGYIGITREWAEDQGTPEAWKSWWVEPEEVRYTQFMGKDNLPFHTVMFPAMLLGASPTWKLADQIKGFHWLQYYGGKFSTTQQRGVFTDKALELFPADYWRYALTASIPEGADSDFKWDLFATLVNKDLAGVLGNFVNRILKFAASKLGDTVPEGGTPGAAEEALIARCRELVHEYTRQMYKLEFRPAMQTLRSLWTLGNQYVDEQAPWKAIKTDRDQAAVAVRTSFNLIALFAVAALPVIPSIASDFLRAIGVDPAAPGVAEDYLSLDQVPAGRPFQVIPPAITQLEESQITELEAEYGS